VNRKILGVAMSGATILAIASSSLAAAHVEKEFGPYTVEMGWLNEPTFTGERNAVVVIIHETSSDKAVTDVNPGDLTVTVSAGDQTSAALPLVPAYDAAEGTGTPGYYTADMIPTQPGDYTFHLSGKIHDTAVDETATASDTTFNAVEDPATIQFPIKVPTTTAISDKVDQLGTRIQTAADAAASAAASVQGATDAATANQAAIKAATDAATAAQTAASAAQTAAASAQSQASQAQTLGIVVGGIGILVGLAGVFLALRSKKAA
jgi:trimeric autotransporter adhesin